ncbi:MAG: replicative DNA helicase [Bryobacteraceae bacterium]|jgi:replicative DNA helicase
MAPTPQKDAAFERGLPSNVYAERMVLGSVLMNDDKFVNAAAALQPDDFSLDKHRRIFRRMLELHNRQEKIDHVTVANELMRYGELESVDGVSYLVSLDEGLPELFNLDSYIQIVKDKATLRQMIFASQEIMQRCFVGEEDPKKILEVAEDSFLRLGEAHSNDELISARDVIDATPGGLDAMLDPMSRVRGTGTGFYRYDTMTGGLHAGELIILAARPAMGKTALALNMALYIATRQRDRKAVAVFSLEMSNDALMTRLICSQANVDQQRFRGGALNEDELSRLKQAAADIYDAPLYIDDSSNTSLLDIRAKVKKLAQQVKREHGVPLGLVIVDYLQLMSAPDMGRNSNRVQEVSALSRGLKLMSKDLSVPFLVLSQLSRAPDQRQGDHRPLLSDLRESGSIEQDADIVNFIFRPEEYNKEKREDLRGQAELIIAKQRNGPTGKVPLVFIHAFTKFVNPAEGDEAPPE